MSQSVLTSHGDRITFDQCGSGPALIFVAGAGPFRAIDPGTTTTAELVAKHGISTIVYDRLGRGESLVDGKIGLQRELAAIAALVDAAGGSAVLCGHSSGCSISLAAAASGLPIDGLVLWEAPLGPQNGPAREWANEVDRRITAGDLEGALLHYMKDLPPEFLEGLRNSPMWPGMVAQVGSLRPDAESLAWAESASLAELFAPIRVPVEALIGEQTFPIMESAADSIVAAIPGATQKRMPGANHLWEPQPMGEELVTFMTALR